MDVGAYLILNDLDLMARSRYKRFEEITLADFKVLEPELLEGFGYILFRDYRQLKGQRTPGGASREKVLRKPARLPSRYRPK